ncbi:hypothetical protein GON26_12320 [Flavobacterium sp. GA093]|uniref:Uncharacterized protein n=1 Tax=Flavobacterium hydrocarbonoxydans TaxID=2683249 RepID=A0A6I4NL53_9FLAO|nr:hypothetical protein [Flavobacterium hydrocarbonoxydans]MWB95148.1 hypothetical protein [Flavobacterium hydrocarbonoxydans]
MSLTITNKTKSKCSKYEFSIYEHTLTLPDLDNYILDILYDETKLNYLFQVNEPLKKDDRIKQLQRFIGNPFRNREEKVLDSEIRQNIKDNESKQSYYTFFAEALLARLNIDFIDNKLITGVVSIGDNISVTGHGADACMYSDDILVLGEAKFYGELYGGAYKITNDTSFISKLEDFIARINGTNNVVLKGINGDITTKTEDEIKKTPLILTGFVLHTIENPITKYEKSYNLVDKINIKDFSSDYKIHLYHLPIESKNDLIFKAQRVALDLIIKEKGL